MNVPVQPIPRELRIVKDAATAFVAVCVDALPAIDALGEPGAELGLALEQAQSDRVSGSAARIGRLAAQLLGEA